MERLFSVADVCGRYQCKAATARKYMRDMEHMESPLMVTERAVGKDFGDCAQQCHKECRNSFHGFG